MNMTPDVRSLGKQQELHSSAQVVRSGLSGSRNTPSIVTAKSERGYSGPRKQRGSLIVLMVADNIISGLLIFLVKYKVKSLLAQ